MPARLNLPRCEGHSSAGYAERAGAGLEVQKTIRYMHARSVDYRVSFIKREDVEKRKFKIRNSKFGLEAAAGNLLLLRPND